MKDFIFALICAIFLSTNVNANTIINPPPVGEGDTVSIVEYLFPDYVRLSDDLDQYFNNTTGEFVFAWEDNSGQFPQYGPSDFDYNDLIMHVKFLNGQIVEWYTVNEFSAAVQNFEYDEDTGVALNLTSIGTVYSVPAMNADGKDHLVTWMRGPNNPPTLRDAPEPGSLLTLGVGVVLLGLMYRRIRK